MKLDLHGHELTTAKIELFHAIDECIMDEDYIIEIVHGFQHGSVLKSYLQSGQFISDMKKNGYFLEICNKSNPGSTLFTIEQ